MKKKIIKKKKPVKQKIDVVIESLVHLEQRVKQLINEIQELKNQQQTPTYSVQMPEANSPLKYWPNTKWNPPEYN